jgi:hypothetical protein
MRPRPPTAMMIGVTNRRLLLGLMFLAFLDASCAGSSGNGYLGTDSYSADDLARASAAARLAYGSTHCVKPAEDWAWGGYECDGDVRCYASGGQERTAWECIHGSSMEGNPSKCVVEQHGSLRVTREEDDPRSCR